MNAQKPKGAPVKVQVSVLASSEPAMALRQAKKSVGEERLQAFSYDGLCIYIDDLKQPLLSNLNPDSREWHELDKKLRRALSEKRKREEQQDSHIRCDGGTPTKLLTAFGKPDMAQESQNEQRAKIKVGDFVETIAEFEYGSHFVGRVIAHDKLGVVAVDIGTVSGKITDEMHGLIYISTRWLKKSNAKRFLDWLHERETIQALDELDNSQLPTTDELAKQLRNDGGTEECEFKGCVQKAKYLVSQVAEVGLGKKQHTEIRVFKVCKKHAEKNKKLFTTIKYLDDGYNKGFIKHPLLNDGGTPTDEPEQIGNVNVCLLDRHEQKLLGYKQDLDSYADIETDNGKLRIYADRIELYKSSQDFPKGIHETNYHLVKTELRFLELKEKLKKYINGDKTVNGIPKGDFGFYAKQNFIFSVRNNGYRVWYPHHTVFEYTPAEEQELLRDWNNQPRTTKVWKRNGEVQYYKEKGDFIPITYDDYRLNPTTFKNIPDIATVSRNIRRRAEEKEYKIIKWQQRVLTAWKNGKVIYSRTKKRYVVEFENGELREYKPRALLFIPALKKSHEERQKHHRKSKMIQAESTANGVKLRYKINPAHWQPPIADTISGLKHRYYCYVCQKTIPKKQTKLSKEDKEIVICGKKTTVKVPVRLCSAGHKCTRATEEELFLNQFTTEDEEEYKARKNAHYIVNDEYNPNDENSQRYTELSTEEQGEKVNPD